VRLGREFYARSVHDVARDLIGCVVRHGETAGRIVETESYHMEEPACHAMRA
jgi:DNA-3-methyladenine glycosylase